MAISFPLHPVSRLNFIKEKKTSENDTIKDYSSNNVGIFGNNKTMYF